MKEGMEGRICEAYLFIVRYFAERGYWPSLREVADGIGLANPSGAAYIMSRLRGLKVLNVVRGGGGAASARRIEVAGLSERLRAVAAEWLTLFPKGQASS